MTTKAVAPPSVPEAWPAKVWERFQCETCGMGMVFAPGSRAGKGMGLVCKYGLDHCRILVMKSLEVAQWLDAVLPVDRLQMPARKPRKGQTEKDSARTITIRKAISIVTRLARLDEIPDAKRT